MTNKILYLKIYPDDYEVLTKIMISAFNEDTSMHTDLKEDGPPGYNDGSLIKWLNEHEKFESNKIVYDNITVGAYTVAIKANNEYSLEMLYIEPKYRKSNIGSIVWKAIEEKYIGAKSGRLKHLTIRRETTTFTLKNAGLYFTKKTYVLMVLNLISLRNKNDIIK